METVKHTPAHGLPPMTDRVPPAPLPSATPWSAPVAPARTEAVPVPPTDPRVALDELVEVVHGARSALLASTDGFAIARSAGTEDEPSHAAMLAAAVGIARQLVQVGDGSELRQVVIDHDRGLLLIWPIGRHRILAVLAMSTVDQVRLRALVRSRTGVLAGSAA